MSNNVPDLARGKWEQILLSFGFTREQLNCKHQACPATGERGDGTPRFRFANRDGRGNFFCSCSDGREDGFALLMCKFGWDFKQACKEVEAMVGKTNYDKDVKKKTDAGYAKRRIDSIIAVSCGLEAPAAAPVIDYFTSRGITKPSSALRAAFTDYGIKEKGLRGLQAIVARIRDSKGEPISLHLTYLQGSEKAKLESPRIICTPTAPTIKGGAVRLFPYKVGTLGVAEGIETALSAHELFGLPVWAVLSTAGMESFAWPEGLQELVIFGDNDEKFGGQAAAYKLAHRARTAKTPVPLVSVEIPEPTGWDWNDILRDEFMRAVIIAKASMKR